MSYDKDTYSPEGGRILDPDGNVVEKINTLGTGHKVDIVNEYEINSALTLIPNLGGVDGFTANGEATTTENILTPKNTKITLANLHYPSVAQRIYVASTSAEDNPTGTGAATVGIGGLDSNYEPIIDVLTLDGQTPVQSNLDFIRVNFFFILSYGSGNTPINGGKRFSTGDLFVGGDGNFTVGIPDLPMMSIDGTNLDTFLRDTANRESYFTTPNDYYWMVDMYQMTNESGKSVRAQLALRTFGDDFWRVITPVTILGGVNNIRFGRKIPIPPRTDVQLRVKTTAAGTAYATAQVAGDFFSIT